MLRITIITFRSLHRLLRPLCLCDLVRSPRKGSQSSTQDGGPANTQVLNIRIPNPCRCRWKCFFAMVLATCQIPKFKFAPIPSCSRPFLLARHCFWPQIRIPKMIRRKKNMSTNRRREISLCASVLCTPNEEGLLVALHAPASLMTSWQNSQHAEARGPNGY